MTSSAPQSPPAGPTGSPAKASRAALGVVFATVFLDLVGFGLIIPIQAFYAQSFGARPAVITLLGAAYSLMQFLFMPYWGRLSDRIGRRPVILSSVAISTIGFALFASADNIWMLFAARMLAGFGNANIGAAQAVIADSTTPADRAKGMGLIGLAFGLGFVLGPAIGGTLGQYGLAVPAWAAAGLGLLNLVSAYVFLPETRPPDAQVPTQTRQQVRAGVLARPRVKALLVLSLVMTTSFALMEQLVALFIEYFWVPEALQVGSETEGHRRAARMTTYAMLTVGLTMAVVQGGLTGKLTKRFGELKLVHTGLLVVLVGLLAMPLVGESGSFVLFVFNCVVLAAGQSLITPSMSGMLSHAVGPDQQGAALGMGQSMSSLARVLGPAAAGALFEVHTRAPYWSGALLVVVGLVVMRGLRRGG
ncbi:MAG: MFS transporter [Myxococcales bacterium]|nr:MFS transporter [Myxococcales bacterium]